MIQRTPRNFGSDWAATLDARRRALGMTFPALARRSGVSEPTVKRICGPGLARASWEHVVRVARALGLSPGLQFKAEEEMLDEQALIQARRIASMVQSTSGLEAQAVRPADLQRLIQLSYTELRNGPRRRLWP